MSYGDEGNFKIQSCFGVEVFLNQDGGLLAGAEETKTIGKPRHEEMP